MKKQIVSLASLLMTCAIQAGPIIYDNGSPDFVNAYYSDKTPGIGGGIESASNFALGADNILADIHWWGGYGISSFAHSADNFTVYIYNDSGGSPGTVAHTIPVGAPTRTDTGVNLFLSIDIFAYEYDLPIPIALTAGTTYWLSILNDTTGDPGGEWLWATSNGLSGDDHSRNLNAGAPDPWGDLEVEFAYHLTGPDPSGVPDAGSTLPLLGTALIGLAWLRFRREALPGRRGFNTMP